MLLAKIKEKLFNRRNKVEIEDVEVKGDIPASIKALIESLGGSSLKMGNYIYNEETNKLEWVEEIPEDYSGILYSIGDDLLEIIQFENGVSTEYAGISPAGVSKIDFPALTHSFNELDSTLKGIVGDAINDNWTDGVACTEAQWNAIRNLLDKSLYLYYEGLYEPYSMNKILTNGINIYKFGTQGVKFGCTIELKYDYSTNLLYAIVAES